MSDYIVLLVIAIWVALQRTKIKCVHTQCSGLLYVIPVIHFIIVESLTKVMMDLNCIVDGVAKEAKSTAVQPALMFFVR